MSRLGRDKLRKRATSFGVDRSQAVHGFEAFDLVKEIGQTCDRSATVRPARRTLNRRTMTVQRSSKYIWVGAGLASLAVIASFGAKPLLAQVRAALTQNVDEPGRAPYQSTVVFKQSTGGCSVTACTIIFASVPAGKRLVATNLTGAVYVDTPGIILPPLVSGAIRVPTVQQTGVFPGPINNENMFGVNAQIRLAYDSGGPSPQLTIVATTPIAFDTSGNTASTLTLSGYLIDCSTSCAAIAQ